jgi:NTP pyrophosphatase (non-canonical NTP hydrolase)
MTRRVLDAAGRSYFDELSGIKQRHRRRRKPVVDLPGIQQQLREFAAERHWDPFHTPKNLVMALAVESAELMEHFQWLTPEQSLAVGDDPDLRQAVAEEVADVAIYLIRLADKLGIDLETAIQDKMQRNAEKYPVHLARGNAVKYNQRKTSLTSLEEENQETES